MYRILGLFLLFVFSLCQQGLSQSVETESDKKIRWSFFIVNSAHLETVRGPDNNTFSRFGIGVEMNAKIKSGLGINTRLSYRAWGHPGFDKRVLPLSLGPSYRFALSPKMHIELLAGAGPAVIMGNDYASFFGSFDLGTAVFFPIPSGKELYFRSSFAQGMSFNSPFNYLDFSIGIRL